jgi:hypothetical protein
MFLFNNNVLHTFTLTAFIFLTYLCIPSIILPLFDKGDRFKKDFFSLFKSFKIDSEKVTIEQPLTIPIVVLFLLYIMSIYNGDVTSKQEIIENSGKKNIIYTSSDDGTPFEIEDSLIPFYKRVVFKSDLRTKSEICIREKEADILQQKMVTRKL